MTEPIRFTAACPGCGTDTEWAATPNPVNQPHAVGYVIACDCDTAAGGLIDPQPLGPQPMTFTDRMRDMYETRRTA